VGAPLDRTAFRASLPTGDANLGAAKIQDALADVSLILEEHARLEGADRAALRLAKVRALSKGVWLARLSEAGRLPTAMIETPLSEGLERRLTHLPNCLKVARALRELAEAKQLAGNHAAAFEHLAQMLTLSRALRFKAPVESYLAGIDVETSALAGLDVWLSRAAPDAALLKTAQDELDRHAAQTPSPRDCLETECYRCGGNLAKPHLWSFAFGAERIPEPWLVNGVAFSLDVPWEAERKTRLWQATWAGLFRGLEARHWELPPDWGATDGKKATTRQILKHWLPAAEGPGASLTREQLASRLDASWLSDERLFIDIAPLRAVKTRSQWRIDAARLSVALARFHVDHGKAAAKLDDLVPKHVAALPLDPYSGRSIGYRISKGEHIDPVGDVGAGQGILFSTGPDRTDHGGRKQGAHRNDDDPQWSGRELDLIVVLRQWGRE
jgi:hypothetical protein